MHENDAVGGSSETHALLELAERLRIGLRNAVLPHNKWPFKEEEYRSARSLLLASPIAQPHLPPWLLQSPTLSSAVTMLVTESRATKGNYVKRCRQTIEQGLASAIAALENAESLRIGDHSSIVARRIQVRIDHFFSAPMSIEPRAMQSLELAPASNSDRLLSLWRNVLLLYPALAAIVEQALPSEAKYSDLVQYIVTKDSVRHPTEVSDRFILGALAECFYERGRTQLKPYGEKLRSERRMSALDLLIAPLMPPRVSPYKVPPLAIALRARRGTFAGSNEYFAYLDSLVDALTTSFNLLQSLDESCGDQQFAVFQEGKRIRVVPFGTWSYCQSPNRSPDEPQPFRGNVVQPVGLFSDESLAGLEGLMDSDATERAFQDFFEQHPEYLQALGPYTNVYPHPVLIEDTGARLIPDFFLENFHTGFCDICDLKRSTEMLIKEAASRPQFRDRLMAGVRQLSDYRDYFEDRENRRRFEERYPGLKAYRPRVILVIGRRESFYDELDRIRLRSELRDWVTVHTYDDVLMSARQWRSRILEGRA